jgi:Uncharacterized protein conserved in cyanobacteria
MGTVENPRLYTQEEFDELVKDKKGRYELIHGVIHCLDDPEDSDGKYEIVDGVPYALAGARRSHQKIVLRIGAEIDGYIRKNKGKCDVEIAPFDVRFEDGMTVQPDVMVVCDPDKISDDLRCYGAPDLVIEVASSNLKYDIFTKQKLYKDYGVREYWVVDPKQLMTYVFLFEKENQICLYQWNESIPVGIYEDAPVQLSLNMGELFEAEQPEDQAAGKV